MQMRLAEEGTSTKRSGWTGTVGAEGLADGRCHLTVGSDCFFFFSSRRRHTRLQGDWSSDVCSSDLPQTLPESRQPRHQPNRSREPSSCCNKWSRLPRRRSSTSSLKHGRISPWLDRKSVV